MFFFSKEADSYSIKINCVSTEKYLLEKHLDTSFRDNNNVIKNHQRYPTHYLVRLL